MNSKVDLLGIARHAMVSQGLEPDFSPDALRELKELAASAAAVDETLPDLTRLPWCSIDNDDSMDLDQLTVAEKHPAGVKILVAVADVDALVKTGRPIDLHARKNTTSIYTGVKIFPMLPELLSTDLTSLSEHEVRMALIMEMVVDPGGDVTDSRVYRALVRNQAKLAYHGVADWLDGKGPLPAKASQVAGMDEQLRIQDQFAQKMRGIRYKQGALDFESLETRAVMKDGVVVELKHERRNRAQELIEDFMIAANGVTAKYLTGIGYPTLRRVVRTPERWERIVQLALGLGEALPHQPDSKALSEFLTRRRAADPLRFPDLSLSIVKLMGRGEYVLQMPGEAPIGHFGLAVRDYAHSTAPNRRYPDLVTHRLLKAAQRKESPPYTREQLELLASHCTSQENAADKVERQVRKSAAALFLSNRIGEQYDAIVTGSSDKGTWARTVRPPVEGKIVQGERGLDVGDQVRVKLLGVNVERGFIDFMSLGRVT